MTLHIWLVTFEKEMELIVCFSVVVLKSLQMCTFDLLSRTNKTQQPNRKTDLTCVLVNTSGRLCKHVFRGCLWGEKLRARVKMRMATHSSTLAWRIPYGQRSLVGYSPWGRRVRHNRAANTSLWEEWKAGPLGSFGTEEISQGRSVSTVGHPLRLTAHAVSHLSWELI